MWFLDCQRGHSAVLSRRPLLAEDDGQMEKAILGLPDTGCGDPREESRAVGRGGAAGTVLSKRYRLEAAWARWT